MALSVRGERKRLKGAVRAGAFALLLACCVLACSCAAPTAITVSAQAPAADASGMPETLRIMGEEPATLDPQRAPEGDTYVLNVFDRLMETRTVDGQTVLEPSLAEQVDVSDDGCSYRFHLREGVRFSNGEAFTAQDVGFTLDRLACSGDSADMTVVAAVTGANDCARGAADSLAGFRIVDDYTFDLALDRPRPSLLAALSATRASMVDAQTTQQAAGTAGASEQPMVGTGPYMLESWEPAASMTLVPNPQHWGGTERYARIETSFITDSLPYRQMFDEGELDILEISERSMDAEYFARGDSYRKSLSRTLRADISCVLLNDAVRPLDDERVRKALQLALDRTTLLKAAADGRGVVENGIFPAGLSGGRNGMPEISYDPEQARALLAQAGVDEGFNLEIPYPESATEGERDLLGLVARMWTDVGLRTTLVALDDEAYAASLRSGTVPCRIASPLAAYDDPEAIVAGLLPGAATDASAWSYAGIPLATRLQEASSIVNEQDRLEAYRTLERDMVVERCVVVPLFTRSQLYVVSETIDGFTPRWNGAVGIDLRGIGAVQRGE